MDKERFTFLLVENSSAALEKKQNPEQFHFWVVFKKIFIYCTKNTHNYVPISLQDLLRKHLMQKSKYELHDKKKKSPNLLEVAFISLDVTFWGCSYGLLVTVYSKLTMWTLSWNNGFLSRVVILIWKSSDFCRIKSLFFKNRLSLSSCSTITISVVFLCRQALVKIRGLERFQSKNWDWGCLKMRLQLQWYGAFQKRVLARFLPLPLPPMGSNYPEHPWALLRTCTSCCRGSGPSQGNGSTPHWLLLQKCRWEESVIQEGIKPCQRVGLLKYLSGYAASVWPQGDAEVPEVDQWQLTWALQCLLSTVGWCLGSFCINQLG